MNRSPPRSVLSAMYAPGPGGHCSGWVRSRAVADGMPARAPVVVVKRVVPATMTWKPRTSPSAAGFQ